MMLTNVMTVACIGLVSATYYASPPPYYLNRLEGAGVYGGGLSGPAGVPFGYYGGAQRVPVAVPYPSPSPSPTPLTSPVLNQQALSQVIAYLNTQSQLRDSTVSGSEPFVIYEDKNSEIAQGRRPSNVRSSIVAHPLSKFRSKNPGARVTGVLPGNLGYVLSVPKKKINSGVEKQTVVVQSQNGPAVSVALGGQPQTNFPNFLNFLRPGSNAVMVVLPMGQMNQFLSLIQNQTPTLSSQSQSQGSKQPTEQYQPTFVPQGLDLVNGEGYSLDLAPEEEVQISEDQVVNPDIIHTSLEEEPAANNDIIPVSVGEGSEAVPDVGTKRINKFVYQRRPGGLYLIPNKVRYSKGLPQDDSTHPSSSTTEPNSNSE